MPIIFADEIDDAERQRRERLMRDVSDDEIILAIQDKRYTYYISWAQRIGALALCSLIEYHYFHPEYGPAPNEEFRFMCKKWRGMAFFIFGVPKVYEFKVRKLARTIGMRIADGVPAEVVSENEMVRAMGTRRNALDIPLIFFPGSAEANQIRQNVWTIENDKGSAVYRNRRDLNEPFRERELKMLDALMLFGKKITPEQVRDYLWFGQMPDPMKPETKQ